MMSPTAHNCIIITVKIASLVATTSFTFYLNNRQYQFLHQQAASPLAVSVTKMGREENACVSDDCSCDHDHDDTSSLPPSAAVEVTGNEIAFVDKIHELARIMEDDIQLVVWEQREQPSFIKALNDPSIPPENLPSFEGMVPALPDLVAEVIKKHTYLPYAIRSRPNVLSEAEADELAEHVDNLVQLFADVAIQSGYIDGNVDGTVDEIPYVHVKLQVLTTDGCRFWHQDSVPFRLVSTLRGPCTEWVSPQFSKATLKQRRRDSKHAQSMKLNDVALFKGRGDADSQSLYDQPGIVHRSPRIEERGESRVVIIIDIPQEGWHYD